MVLKKDEEIKQRDEDIVLLKTKVDTLERDLLQARRDIEDLRAKLTQE